MTSRSRSVVAFAALLLASVGIGAAVTAQPAERQPTGSSVGRQPNLPSQPGRIEGITRQPTDAARGVLLDPNDTVIILLDHQTGLFQTVKDVPVAELRNNTVALANIARMGKAPIIYTASEPDGPNGPIMEELDQFKEIATFVRRQGEVSAWDNADFVKAVEATGRKTLVMAGVWTSVCVAFPALQAKAEGYKVYFVMDASGDMSEMASRATQDRMIQGGCIPVTTNVVLCEFQRTWNRSDAAQWGAIYQQLVPHYKAVAESYTRAQNAARQNQEQPARRGQ